MYVVILVRKADNGKEFHGPFATGELAHEWAGDYTFDNAGELCSGYVVKFVHPVDVS